MTVTVIVCESESSLSVVVIVNVSLPLKFSDAVNAISLPSSVAVISLPPVILNVRASPSTSDAETLILVLVSSSKDISYIVASTGASFTGSIVNVTVALSSSSPSDTVNVKLSSPL